MWYNALRFVADLVREGGNDIFADELNDLAEMAGKSFVEVFRNEYGYLFDYVDGYMMDWSVRPNMIFAVAFDYSPLDRAQKKTGTRHCDKRVADSERLAYFKP